LHPSVKWNLERSVLRILNLTSSMCVAYSSDRGALNELFLPQASLDKQIKELNLRIVDLETKTLSLNSSRPSNVNKRLESRIEELQNQLNQSAKDSSRLKTADKGTREVMIQLQESERQRSRLEEEMKSYENRIQTMRQSMDEMVGNILWISDFWSDSFGFAA
jgi:chromosome segregation ATPase